MPNGYHPVKIAVPLFSTDYAQVNREISEWNRRARPSFASIEAEINQLRLDLYSLTGTPGARATATSFGIVETDKTVPAPVVYLKTTVDYLLSLIQAQINILNVQVATLIAGATPLLHITGASNDPNTAGLIGVEGQWCQNDTTGGRWMWGGVVWRWI